MIVEYYYFLFYKIKRASMGRFLSSRKDRDSDPPEHVSSSQKRFGDKD